VGYVIRGSWQKEVDQVGGVGQKRWVNKSGIGKNCHKIYYRTSDQINI